MRPVFNYRLLSAIVFLALCALFLVERIWNPPTQRIYAEFIKASTVTPDEIAFFTAVLGDIARHAHDSRKLNVNGPYNQANINIALVDFERTGKSRALLPPEGLQAFPPNLLVIDTKIARDILLHAFNDALSVAQLMAEIERDNNESAILHKAATAGALGSMPFCVEMDGQHDRW